MILLNTGCLTANYSKRLDIVPDKIDAKYKTDQDFNGSGYEFCIGWNVK